MSAVWEVWLRRELRAPGARFQLELRFSSQAQRLVLRGPSGAGKTQTLRLIAGVERPDAGRVAVAGTVLLDSANGLALTAQQRRLPVVFQDYALWPHLTVRQNIAFGRHRGWRNPGRRAGDALVERWIEAFGLAGVATLLPHQLSGGQRQRTALARAMATQPRALLLDEPFAAVDSALRQRLREELLALQSKVGLPMLLITHDEDDIRHFAQDVVEMVNGGLGPQAPGQAGCPAGPDRPA